MIIKTMWSSIHDDRPKEFTSKIQAQIADKLLQSIRANTSTQNQHKSQSNNNTIDTTKSNTNDSIKPDNSRYKLVIHGKLLGLNEYINAERRNKYAAAKIKKEVQELIEYEIKQCIDGVHFDCPVIMHYTWYETNKKRDLDNIAFAKKFIQDALVKCGVIDNDGWSNIVGFTDSFDIDKCNPRIEVEFIVANNQ